MLCCVAGGRGGGYHKILYFSYDPFGKDHGQNLLIYFSAALVTFGCVSVVIKVIVIVIIIIIVIVRVRVAVSTLLSTAACACVQKQV
jgi:hypothetical protein